jgi:hypothetical protein
MAANRGAPEDDLPGPALVLAIAGRPAAPRVAQVQAADMKAAVLTAVVPRVAALRPLVSLAVHAVLQIVLAAPLSLGSATGMLLRAQKEVLRLALTGMRPLVASALPLLAVKGADLLVRSVGRRQVAIGIRLRVRIEEAIEVRR